MKYLFTLLIAFVVTVSAQAQINAYYVVSSAGFNASDRGALSSTIGELALINTFKSGKFTLTQGFQQGDYVKFAPTSLPVTLLDFTGHNDGAVNILNWQTASEINNQGFDIERLNAQNEFEKIGYVEGHGNSNSLLDYEFHDTKPLTGDNYYRLKQIDVDGKFTYSEVISMYYGEAMTTDVSVYPIPVADQLNVMIHNNLATSGSMTITNVVGATIYEGTIDIYEGTTVKRIDMSTYASGQYFVKITTGSATKTIHIIRQ